MLDQPEQQQIPGRKRKPITVDEAVIINGEEMKKNLSDTTSLARKPKIAPDSKQAMKEFEKEVMGIKHAFSVPNMEGLLFFPPLFHLNCFKIIITT